MFRYLDQVETGILHINSPTVGGEAQVPFGGLKETGVGGREQGTTALDFFTEWKSVYIDYTARQAHGELLLGEQSRSGHEAKAADQSAG